jgi:hypothetical protein
MLLSGLQPDFATCKTGVEAAQSGTDVLAEKLVALSHKVIGIAQQSVQNIREKEQRATP